MHDGSSIELGQLGYLEDENGNEVGLPADSPWRFDLRKYCEVVAYHEDPAEVVSPTIVNAYAANAKAVNEEDKRYHNRRKSLIEPETLKRWIDLGYRDDLGRDVVIFDTGFDWSMDTSAIYAAGHIPGAHHVQPTTFYANRSEGTIGFGAGVLEGAAMDAFIQPYGIDENTAVVFTGNHVWGTVRAYWTFRYWGFSQEQLFVLNGRANGGTSVWTDAGYSLQTAAPPMPIASTFSVSEWPGNMDTVRATTQEFMMVVTGDVPFSLVADARSEEEWNVDVIAPDTNIFGFRVKDSVWYTWGNALEGGEDGDHVFRSAAELVEDLDDAGITSDVVPYTFCQGGGRAAVLFFVFEEILGRPSKMHDGSSMELGQMGHLNDGMGADLGLPEDSPWRFDTDTYCDEILYSDPADVVPVVVIDAYAGAAVGVNETDKAYYTGD
jgi:3-mercaptopyruvate sulfurtransferase SseA